MRILDHGNSVAIWLSARDTYEWARKPGAAWPCSQLEGRRLYVRQDAPLQESIETRAHGSSLSCSGAPSLCGSSGAGLPAIEQAT